MKHTTASLKGRLFLVFLVMFFYLLLLTVVYFFADQSLDNRFREMTDRNHVFTELLLAQGQIKEQFEICLRSRDPSSIQELNALNSRITYLIQQLREISVSSRESLTYLRIISNIHTYQVGSTQKLLSRIDLDPEDYREISFLNTLYESYNKQAQELAVLELRANIGGYADYYEGIKKWENIIFIVMIPLFIVLVAGAAILINQVLKSMEALRNAANSFSEGKVQEKDISPTSFTELNELGAAFNTMKHDIHKYVDKLKRQTQLELELQREHVQSEKKDKLLEQARLDFLRSQINPHFLYNALNIIGKSTVLNDPEKSLSLIEAMSQILRYTLEHPGDLVQLKDEIDIVNSYLLIQQSRYGMRLKCEVAIHKNTANCLIPPMIIQPLVENAIKHCIDNIPNSLEVTVSARMLEAKLCIRVEDNGPGIEAPEGLTENSGIGLQNVRRRIELRYKDKGSFAVTSTQQAGTTIEMILPVEVPEDD